jgi:hypothetical protein
LALLQGFLERPWFQRSFSFSGIVAMKNKSLLCLPIGFGFIPVVFAILLIGAGQSRPSQGEKEQTADSLTPIASSIKPANVTIELDGKKQAISVDYAQRGATVFVLPVWVVTEEVKLGYGTQWRTCKVREQLIKATDSQPLRMRFRLTNLLGDEKAKKAVHDRLKEEIASNGGKKEGLHIDIPQLQKHAFRVTLYASGTGKVTPSEMPLSETQPIPPAAVEHAEDIYLDLLPGNVSVLEADKGQPLTLGDVYLRVDGTFKALFEKL